MVTQPSETEKCSRQLVASRGEIHLEDSADQFCFELALVLRRILQINDEEEEEDDPLAGE